MYFCTLCAIRWDNSSLDSHMAGQVCIVPQMPVV